MLVFKYCQKLSDIKYIHQEALLKVKQYSLPGEQSLRK
jgi:hypothetical protein